MLYELFHQIPLPIIQFASSLVNVIFPSYTAGTKCPVCEKISQYSNRCLNICFWVNKQKVSRPFRERCPVWIRFHHVKLLTLCWALSCACRRVCCLGMKELKGEMCDDPITAQGTDNAAFRADCGWLRSHVSEHDLVNRKQKVLVESSRLHATVWFKHSRGRRAIFHGDSLRAACPSLRRLMSWCYNL